MEKAAETAAVGSEEMKLKKSFRESVGCLLNAFSFEDFSTAFPKFTGAQQEHLYRLYVQIITSLHDSMQDEFDFLCHETKVGTIMDTVALFVEQQKLDPLFSQKTNLEHVKHDLLSMKKNEIFLLQDLLEKAENQKHSLKAQIKLVRKTREETSVTTDAVEKLRSMMVKYA
ncbi:hypothetical protein vseg_016598 [Gypsophila vaccaria]